MRSLKTLVVMMGIILVGGFALLVAMAVGKLSRGANVVRSFASTTIDIPRDAQIGTMAAGADRLVLEFVLPDGAYHLIIVDLATGLPLGTITLHAQP